MKERYQREKERGREQKGTPACSTDECTEHKRRREQAKRERREIRERTNERGARTVERKRENQDQQIIHYKTI